MGLGIDTGSIYTHAAMVDLDERHLLAWTRSPTTSHDLSEGIAEAASSLLRSERYDPDLVKLVGLSTTLATDSILEGRGGKVGLIGIGWDHDDPDSFGADHCSFIKGGHDSKGRELHPLDEDGLRTSVQAMKDKVDAFVVSSMFGIHQPGHEDRARALIRELTRAPVVAAYELSGELGVVERSVTGVLNARLLPVIADFLDRIEEVFRDLHVPAKVMVLKGDGSVMSLGIARQRPVETVLSGPAASLLGGTVLSGLDNCLVIDMGGTSTDIAFIDRGFPRINREGAKVAGWRTMVQSIDATTVALGGDSEIVSDLHGEVRIGPRRVLPLALAGQRSAKLSRRIMERQRTDFLVVSRKGGMLSGDERRVYDKVGEMEMPDDDEVRAALPEQYWVKDIVARLVRNGYLLSTGLTPTDIFNLEGLCEIGDRDASMAGVQHYLEGTHLTVKAYCAKIMHSLLGRVAEEVVRKMVVEEVGELPKYQSVDSLVRLLAGERCPGSFRVSIKLDRPIVGIGGPARLLMPSLRDLLGVDVVIPEGGPAGNAVGAVCSRISETLTLRIQPLSDGQFQLLTPFGGTLDFPRAEEAIAQAKDLAGLHVRGKAEHAGAQDVRLRVDVHELRFRDQLGMEHLDWIEVVARASGLPR